MHEIKSIDVAAALQKQYGGDRSIEKTQLNSVGRHVEGDGPVRAVNARQERWVAPTTGVQLVHEPLMRCGRAILRF